MQIEIKILDKEFYKNGVFDEGTPEENYAYETPTYATSGSAAIDLAATKDYTIYPGEQQAIPTGLAIHIGSIYQPGFCQGGSYAGIIIPRSGLGSKGLVLANTIGLIDEDYQGEVTVMAWNRLEPKYLAPIFHTKLGVTDKNTIQIKAGDRIAQLAFIPIIKPSFKIVEDFTAKTERNTGSFGSTG